MKKRILWTAGLAAAMTVGMAMTSLAGWEQQGTDWYYYKDSNHQMVRNDWAQSGNFWYYLGDDGKMVTNSMIDDTYYVDGNGAMTVNGWQYFADDWDEEPAWRYFTANGRVYKDGMKVINNAYYYFSDTKMVTGWVEDGESTYYFKPDGSRASGWRWLTENDEDSWHEYWYYFNTDGKMIKEKTKTIEGVSYIFDKEGRMLTGWVDTESFTSSAFDNLSTYDINDLRYFNENGAAVNGWQWLESPSDYEAHYYYFKNGRAYSGEYMAKEVGNGYHVAKIDNEYYCFDENGQMVTGLIEATNGKMYFDTSNGQMCTGRVTVYDDEYYGETFYFKESGGIGTRGVGISGANNGYLYEDGQIVCAEDGMKYEVKEVDGKDYMVSESGKIKTSGTVKDGDGRKWKITKSSSGGYQITEVKED